MKNINLEALHRFLTDPQAQLSTEYMAEDYGKIAQRSLDFQRKTGQLPSVKYLLANYKKLSKLEDKALNKAESDRMYDILDLLDGHKGVELGAGELAELSLQDWKRRRVRELTLEMTKAHQDDNDVAIERLSREIGEVSRREVGGDRFLKEDDKDNFHQSKAQMSFVPTGILEGSGLPVSRVPTCSFVSIGAASGQGKTILAVNSLVNRFLAGDSCLFLSFEISKTQLYLRMKAIITGVPLSEIHSKEYTLEESADKIMLSGWVIKKEISLEDALTLYYEKGIEAFDELPDRTNILKIVAAAEKEDYEKARALGRPLEELPNDVEILNMLREYGDRLDYFYLDYVSEPTFADSRSSRELNITNMSRGIKLLALEKSFVAIVLSQIESEQQVYGLFQFKYAKSLMNISDMAVFIAGTKEMKEEGMSTICVRKNRSGIGGIAYLVEMNYNTQTPKYIDETCSISELTEQIKKDLKAESK